MPVIETSAIRPRSIAMICGNGPSARGNRWREDADRLGKFFSAKIDCFVCNYKFDRRPHPKFAVAVGPEVIVALRSSPRGASRYVLGSPASTVGSPDSVVSIYGSMVDDPDVLLAPESWPPMASGPLGLWTATALGYSTVLLYGMDGTIGVMDDETRRHAQSWETACLMVGRARRDGWVPLINRVWSGGVNQPAVDPLRLIISQTINLDHGKTT